MKIPGRGTEKFVREVCDQCLVSLRERAMRGLYFRNYALLGAEDQDDAATYNKTFAYLDDLESLLYSPVSLRFHISDPDFPTVLEDAKGRSAAAHLRRLARQSDTDTEVSQGVWWSLVKGKAFLKQLWKGDGFSPDVVQPETMGVFRETHDKLDRDMEAFVHCSYITPYQLRRMIWDRPNRAAMERRAQNYLARGRDDYSDSATLRQVIVGGLRPYQAQGAPSQGTRGIVDWMGSPTPMLDPRVMQNLLRLDEVWIWDDDANDWATFQMIGDMLVWPAVGRANALAFNKETGLSVDELKGEHPFVEFCPNPLKGYFWGRSEVTNVALLQESLNKRINGIQRLLRMQERPPKTFIGGSGVNQHAISRYDKPGGWFADGSPNMKVESQAPVIPAELPQWIHELERMFDEMGGLPPIAKGHGESGVRSAGHADTLVRMFSPRFKDRALLVERSVEGLGALMLDLARVHIAKKMVTWVPQQYAGNQQDNDLLALSQPPAPGMVPVLVTYAGLSDDVSLTVDAHSSSPAFSQDARSLVFDLFKIGAMTPQRLVEHVDSPDPESLVADMDRRAAEKAAEIHEAMAKDPSAALKLLEGGKKK